MVQFARNVIRMPTAAPIVMNSDARVILGRECGSCSLRYKASNIHDTGTAARKWCKHLSPVQGCTIHEALPSQCAAFNCLWRTQEALPPHWKPEQSKMQITISPLNGFIYMRVD